MKTLKAFILFGSAALFMSASPALSDHIPQYLIDGVFYEMEQSWCRRDPECVPADFTTDDDYGFCMKEVLHDQYTRGRLEEMLNYKSTYGDFSAYENEEYDFYAEMVFWVGC